MLDRLVEGSMGDDKRFWLGFNLLYGIGPARLRILLDHFGDIESAWYASPEKLSETGIGPKTIKTFLKKRDLIDLEKELERVRRSGFKLKTWDDDDYPIRLREIPAPPPLLYVWGDLQELDRWAVAVVGTRNATAYGTTVAQEIAAALAANGITVVSGLARGIDAVSHQSALEAGGRTIAVLGSGLDHIYPPENRRLATAIVENGAVVSDYPLGTKPEAKNFPPRNRIISGLAMLTVVVEAGEGSGALITADFAVEQGREVFAVPGNLHRPSSRGTNRLIRSGARPLLAPEDVLEALNLDVVARQEIVSQELPEDETELLVLQALGPDPIHVDELRTRCNMPISQITASLAMLELKGRARQVGGMQYVRVREPSGVYRVD
jgi:DNA processing protein